jgi:anti-anti-sigma factor
MVGEIDISNWAELDSVYATVVAARPGPTRVDLSEATFVDSHALSFLVRIERYVSRSGHRLTVDSPNRTVARAMEICGVDRLLTIRSAGGE